MFPDRVFDKVCKHLRIVNHVRFFIARDGASEFREDVHLLLPIFAEIDIGWNNRGSRLHGKHSCSYRRGCWLPKEVHKAAFDFACPDRSEAQQIHLT